MSVAADLDAGRLDFYVDGLLTSERSQTLAPGVGPFQAGAVSSGSSLRINFGSEPFAYGVPAGYEPWFGGNEDASGACIPDTVTPAPPAPVRVDCTGVNECVLTSFQASTSAATDLVILGVSDSGGDIGWVWGTDENGQPIRVQTGPARRGSIVVDVNRPGRVALVLSAYEATDWTVRSGAGTELASVSAYGMYRPAVSGLGPDVPLDIHTICTESDWQGCTAYSDETFPVGAYQWPHSTGGGDTQGFVKHVEARLRLPLKIFAGADQARGFVVE